jgi:PAS domain S-box-containing protein
MFHFLILEEIFIKNDIILFIKFLTNMIHPVSVLYVDDEPALLEIGKLYLERTKEFAVTIAPSASVALDLLKSGGIQAIVSDYQMPEMDGIEFLKQVRATDPHIPFIVFTGRGREEIVIQAFEGGADFYVQKGGAPKPQFAELVHKIKAAVEHRQANAQIATLNRLYTVLSATNKAIVRIHDKKELLNEICRIVVDDGGFTMAWAGIANPEKHLIEPTAASGHIDSYLDAISISTDDVPHGRGPTGTAFRERRYNICNDIESDPKMAPWRNGALARGYHSLAAFPFALDTRNAGVITFYASEPGFFNEPIVRLLQEQSDDISFALVNLDHEEQRITAENELKNSELRYRRLFETAQDAILILDGDTGEIIDANKFILDMLGYPLDYFVSRHLWELGFLKDKSFAQNAFAKLKTEGYIRYEDLPLETKEGRAISVEFVSNVYLVGKKRIIQCNIRDITERKMAHEILQVSETRYRRLFETARDGILILDRDSGEIIDANTFIINMLGYPLSDFIGRQLWELGFLKDTSLAREAFAKLKTEGYIRYEDLPLETKEGKAISVEFVSNVYCVGNRSIIQCNIRDITERKMAHEILQVSETRYRRLFETAQDGILILDRDSGEIIDANTFIINMLGYPLSDFIGRQLWELGFLKDKSLAREAFAKLKTDWYIRYEDLPLETKQGKAISVEFVSNVYCVGDRRIIQCNIRDVTERKRAEEALALASRKLNLMSGITRHDIMNQLTGLSCSLELALETVKDPEGTILINLAQKAVDTIHRQITFTREYEDLGVKAPEWQRFSDIIHAAVSQVVTTNITFEIPGDHLEVYADPLLIKVFYNLFDNARQHGGAVTRICISHQPAGNGLIITVADNGRGISPEDKPHLFERGFGKNTGLGLFHSREILSITGISICETGIPGKGAQFEIAVPEGAFRFTEERTQSMRSEPESIIIN